MRFRDIQIKKALLLGSQRFLIRMICKEIVIIQMLARSFNFLGQSRVMSKTEEQGHTQDSARPRGKDHYFALILVPTKTDTVVWFS